MDKNIEALRKIFTTFPLLGQPYKPEMTDEQVLQMALSCIIQLSVLHKKIQMDAKYKPYQQDYMEDQ